MKLLTPRFEILEYENTLDGIKRHIERCARTCYKSEDLIKEGSADKFIDRLIKVGHFSVLEHGAIYLMIPMFSALRLSHSIEDYELDPHTKVTYEGDIYYISSNLRVLIENRWESDLQFMCEPTARHDRRISVRINSDIHFYKDITRHRKMSFSIESTRYCSYIKDKFGSEIKFTRPVWLSEGEESEFISDCEVLESIYMKWLNIGWSAEQAAYFLGQGTSADINMSGFVSDWVHVFKLRADSHAHPTVREIMYPLKDEFITRGYISDNDGELEII